MRKHVRAALDKAHKARCRDLHGDEEAYEARIAELDAEVERLRARVVGLHRDVIAVKAERDELREALEREATRAHLACGTAYNDDYPGGVLPPDEHLKWLQGEVTKIRDNLRTAKGERDG